MGTKFNADKMEKIAA